MVLRSFKVRALFVWLFFGALIASALVYFANPTAPEVSHFHYFGVPAVKVSQIKLEVIYFVPSDQEPDPKFYPVLKEALTRIQQFHVREFASMNALRYALYPAAVRGKESSSFYDAGETAHGNPGAIRRIFTEAAARVYNPQGDLHNAQFVGRKENELPIRVFVYQGVGASSGVLSVIVSYDYFTKTNYGATTLYHEVLHNLGVPDAYDHATNVSQADDIMGSGRMKPILETYVRDEIKKRMIE